LVLFVSLIFLEQSVDEVKRKQETQETKQKEISEYFTHANILYNF